MGWFGDVMDNVFGFDPGSPIVAQPTPEYQLYLWQQEQNRLAAQAKADADAAAAQLQQQQQQTPQQQPQQTPAPPAPPPFDPSPFRSQVDTSFSLFTPEFYAKKYADFYNPFKSGVESQYGTAKDTLTAGLAKKGLADSQQGRSVFQQLDALRDQAFNTGQQGAQSFQTSLANQAQAAKDTLYGGIGANANNADIGTRATAEANRVAGINPSGNTLSGIFDELTRPYIGTRTPGGPVNPEIQAFATGGNLNLANNTSSPAASTKVVGKKKY